MQKQFNHDTQEKCIILTWRFMITLFKVRSSETKIAMQINRSNINDLYKTMITEQEIPNICILLGYPKNKPFCV